jgi:hypothetical protein
MSRDGVRWSRRRVFVLLRTFSDSDVRNACCQKTFTRPYGEAIMLKLFSVRGLKLGEQKRRGTAKTYASPVLNASKYSLFTAAVSK